MKNRIPLILVIAVIIAVAILVAPFLLRTGDRDVQHSMKLPVNVSFWDNFVVLEWDANPASDHVTSYILYMGTQSHSYPARWVLGNQTSVGILNNHPTTYCALSARNATGEGTKSAEISFHNPFQ